VKRAGKGGEAEAESAFNESKNSYFQSMVELSDHEAANIQNLQEYLDAQLAWHKRCVDIFTRASEELSSKAQRATSRPKPARSPATSSYDSGNSYASTPSYMAPTPSYTAPTPSYTAPTSSYGGGGDAYGGYGGGDSSYSAPPQRQPPPPPPARNNSSTQRAQALYDFAGESESELSFYAGDVINITKMVNADWAEGELNGRVGIFPLNYVQMQ